MDFEELFGLIVILALLLALIVGAGVACAPHNVDYYYLSSGNGSTGTCVYAHWTWHADERTFCTNDANQALDVAARANLALKAAR